MNNVLDLEKLRRKYADATGEAAADVRRLLAAIDALIDGGGELDLDAIEARANAATPGPWEPNGPDIHAGGEQIAEGGPVTPYADAEFVAHARTDVPALVAEVRRLLAAIESGLIGTTEGDIHA